MHKAENQLNFLEAHESADPTQEKSRAIDPDMSVIEALYTRHSARGYLDKPIPEEVLKSDPDQDALMIGRLFGLKRNGYFLFFGALDPKKNINRIIEAYLASGSETPLVLVGARDWGMAEEKKSLADGVSIQGHSISDDRIMKLDYMPRALLFRLIRTAKAVLFPSLYEGFGLPALEAIQLGTPVISSTTSSLPEVVGAAGLLVDPYSVPAIAQAIGKLDSDEALRRQLIAATPAQAGKFSDAHYRARLTQLYETTLQQE